MPGTSIKDALKKFEEVLGNYRHIYESQPDRISDFDPLLLVEANKGCETVVDCKKVTLVGMIPPIEKMDNTLGTLKACVHLSLGSNAIDKIAGLAGLENLRVLALSRNAVKKLDNLDMVPELEELWISYNQLSSLAGIEKLTKLRVLFCSNNQIAKWEELDRLRDLPFLKDINLLNNPIYADMDEATRRVEVLKRLPHLTKLDGRPVQLEELEAAGVAN